jgi:hypothetical protein
VHVQHRPARAARLGRHVRRRQVDEDVAVVVELGAVHVAQHGHRPGVGEAAAREARHAWARWARRAA